MIGHAGTDCGDKIYAIVSIETDLRDSSVAQALSA